MTPIHARTQRYGMNVIILGAWAHEPIKVECAYVQRNIRLASATPFEPFTGDFAPWKWPHPAQVQKAVDLLGWQCLELFPTKV